MEINTENTRLNRNVIWEKVKKLEDKLGIFESLKTNPCKYPRRKNENLKIGISEDILHGYKMGLLGFK